MSLNRYRNCRRCRRQRRNPTTPAGYHLRRGMLVLWEDDRGQFILARVVSASREGAALFFPDGHTLNVPIDRLHELPRHESTARRRGRW